MKKLGILTLVSIFLSTFTTAQATLFQGFPSDSDVQAITIEDRLDNFFSVIQNNTVQNAIQSRQGTETPDSVKFCDEFNARGCNLNSSADLSIGSVLPVCESKVENCIKSLEFITADGKVEQAKFDRYFKGKTFTGIPDLGMPGGSRVSLWKAPGFLNSEGTDQYIVNTQINWNYLRGSATVTGFQASVYAVKPSYDSRYKDSGVQYGPLINADGSSQSFGSHTESGEFEYDGSCVAVEPGMCAKKVDFAPNTRIKLNLIVSNKVTGWLHGRISKPDISVTPIDSVFNELSVAADAVVVPMMYAQYKQSQISAQFKEGLINNWQGRGLMGKTFYRQYLPDAQFAMIAISELADSVNNTAAEKHTFWNVTSINNASNQKCLFDTSRLVGFVTTNAMAYSGGAPSWNGESLQYQVAGLHYLPDGKELTVGTYDLAIRSDAARCLYGFTNAPISASITVTSQDGSQKVSTTVVNEKNGWLYLAAYGFNFSSPNINVKLTQSLPTASPTPTPTASPTPSSTPVVIASPAPIATTSSVIKSPIKSVPKKTTITCIKGKTIKKVTAVNPKCPTGFKKK